VITYTFAVAGMHCGSCGLLIDETLEDDLPGVTRSETSVRARRTTVRADSTVTPQQIIAAIGDAGYQATLETTTEAVS
jgi:copper chaperone